MRVFYLTNKLFSLFQLAIPVLLLLWLAFWHHQINFGGLWNLPVLESYLAKAQALSQGVDIYREGLEFGRDFPPILAYPLVFLNSVFPFGIKIIWLIFNGLAVAYIARYCSAYGWYGVSLALLGLIFIAQLRPTIADGNLLIFLLFFIVWDLSGRNRNYALTGAGIGIAAIFQPVYALAFILYLGARFSAISRVLHASAVAGGILILSWMVFPDLTLSYLSQIIPSYLTEINHIEPQSISLFALWHRWFPFLPQETLFFIGVIWATWTVVICIVLVRKLVEIPALLLFLVNISLLIPGTTCLTAVWIFPLILMLLSFRLDWLSAIPATLIFFGLSYRGWRELGNPGLAISLFSLTVFWILVVSLNICIWRVRNTYDQRLSAQIRNMGYSNEYLDLDKRLKDSPLKNISLDSIFSKFR